MALLWSAILDDGEGIVAFVSPRLQEVGEAAVGSGVLGIAEASGDVLFDDRRADVALGVVASERHVGCPRPLLGRTSRRPVVQGRIASSSSSRVMPAPSSNTPIAGIPS